jgi:membrane-associated phospholipid phosphatase
LLAIAIALSRVYLGVHFPADSVGGALLGLAVGALVIWMRQRLSSGCDSDWRQAISDE